MQSRSQENNSGSEYEVAGRFYPSLHAFIQAGCLEYQPERVTFAQLKALALLQSGTMPFFTCKCGDFTLRAKEVCTALNITPSELAKVCTLRMGDGRTQFPTFALRQQDVGYAITKAKAYEGNTLLSKTILSCGWGVFLIPGRTLERYRLGDLIGGWMAFVESPARQVGVMMELMDELLLASGGDFELACSMFIAGNDQLTKTGFGKQARMTLNRLHGAGHRVN